LTHELEPTTIPEPEIETETETETEQPEPRGQDDFDDDLPVEQLQEELSLGDNELSSDSTVHFAEDDFARPDVET